VKIKINEIEPNLSSLTRQLKGVIGDPRLNFDHSSDINLTSIYNIYEQLDDLLNQKKTIFHSLTHYNENLSDLIQFVKDQNLVNKTSNCVLITNDYFYRDHYQITDQVIYFDPIRFYYSHFFRGQQPLSLCWQHNKANEIKFWPLMSRGDMMMAHKTRIFLSPCRLYLDQNRTHFRYRLFKKLFQHRDRGFMSGPGRPENPRVVEDLIDWNNISTILVPETYNLTQQKIPNFGGIPPNRQYYRESFISIYGETLETGCYVAPTEKSYIPLWRGHLIFPFSCSGTIAALRSMGLQFPDNYIDYSYDQVKDDQQRWAIYEKELDRILSWSRDHWKTVWYNTIGIRMANQEVLMQPCQHLDMQKLVDILQ